MNIIKKYLFCFIKLMSLLLFMSYYISITMFYHSHNVNGQIITHSHLYNHDKTNKNPYESHSHTSSQYNVIQHLNEANWDNSSASFQLPSPIIINIDFCFEYSTPLVNSNDYSFPQLRAPPII